MNYFYQLPHFSEAKLKNLKKINNKIFNKSNTAFADFLTLPSEEQTKLLKTEFSDSEISDIKSVISFIPNYSLKVEVFTEGFEDIIIDDLVTIKVTITRENLEEGEEIGLVHSKGYTEAFPEQVALNLLVGKRVVNCDILTIKTRTTTHEFIHPMKDAGLFKLSLEMISLSFKGLDKTEKIEINVVKTSDKRKEQYTQISKREVKKIEPSFFQKMVGQLLPVGGDEEEEESEEEKEEGEKEKEGKKEGEGNEEGKNNKEKNTKENNEESNKENNMESNENAERNDIKGKEPKENEVDDDIEDNYNVINKNKEIHEKSE